MSLAAWLESPAGRVYFDRLVDLYEAHTGRPMGKATLLQPMLQVAREMDAAATREAELEDFTSHTRAAFRRQRGGLSRPAVGVPQGDLETANQPRLTEALRRSLQSGQGIFR